MTDKLYLITEAQIQQIQEIFSLGEGASRSDIQAADSMLQSLPMVTDEPMATVTDVPPAFGYSTYIRWHNSPPPPTGTCLYTSPQALTQITVDDVSDEMIAACMPHWMMQETEDIREIFVQVYNAVIKHRSEA